MKNKKLLASIVMAGAGLLVACGTTENTTSIDSQVVTSSESSSMSSATSEGGTTGIITGENDGPVLGIETMVFQTGLEEAVDIYLETYPDTLIHSIVFEDTQNRYEYHFTGFDDTNQYTVVVDADSGEVRQQEMVEEPLGNPQPLTLEGLLAPEAAITAAVDDVGIGYVEGWELNTEDGSTFYKIHITDTDSNERTDVFIDASSGEAMDTE